MANKVQRSLGGSSRKPVLEMLFTELLCNRGLNIICPVLNIKLRGKSIDVAMQSVHSRGDLFQLGFS